LPANGEIPGNCGIIILMFGGIDGLDGIDMAGRIRWARAPGGSNASVIRAPATTRTDRRKKWDMALLRVDGP
jgi:hypothetical protein